MRSLQIGSVPHWCEKFISYSSDQLWGYWQSPNSSHVQGQDFQGLRRERVLHHAARETAHHTPSWGKAHIFGNLLSGIKQKTFLSSPVAHCASPHHISAATASRAPGPWPTHRAQNKCAWAPLAGLHSCATNTEMLQAVANWKQSREYWAPMEDILFWSEADISKNPQFVPK